MRVPVGALVRVLDVLALPDWTAARTADGRVRLSAKNPLFWPAAAIALDVLAACRGQASTAAETLGISTANLVAFLAEDPKLWQEANRIRVLFGLKPLKST